MKNATSSTKFFALALVGLSATTTAFAQEYKERGREGTSERDAETKDRDSATDWMAGGRYESVADYVLHCPGTEVYFDGACRDHEWVQSVTFAAYGMTTETAKYGGESEMRAGNSLYRFDSDTLTVISGDEVSRSERPRDGQSVSDYWVSHEWVFEELSTDDGVIAVGTRYEPVRNRRTGDLWRETGSFEWNPNYDSLSWVDGEPVLAPLPYSSVENGCVEESAALLAVGSCFVGALSSGNWWAAAGTLGGLVLAESNLLECLGVFQSDDPDTDGDGTDD